MTLKKAALVLLASLMGLQGCSYLPREIPLEMRQPSNTRYDKDKNVWFIDGGAPEVLDAQIGVLFYGADWCYGCQVNKPGFFAKAAELKDKPSTDKPYVFAYVDLTKEGQNEDWQEQYRVWSIPTIVITQNGKKIKKFNNTGNVLYTEIIPQLEQILDKY